MQDTGSVVLEDQDRTAARCRYDPSAYDVLLGHAERSLGCPRVSVTMATCSIGQWSWASSVMAGSNGLCQLRSDRAASRSFAPSAFGPARRRTSLVTSPSA